MDAPNHPYLPEYWSNPQSVKAYIKSARENLLNIVPPSIFEQGYTTFPSRFGDTHYISDPDILRVIMKTRVEDFPKSRSNNLVLEPFVPKSIFIADGQNWRDMHDLMIPVFTRSNVESFEGDIHRILDNYLAKHDFSSDGNDDITPFIQNLTYEIISQILIADPDDESLNAIQHLFEEFLASAGRMQLWDVMALRYEFLPNLRNFTHRKQIQKFRQIGLGLVRNRIKTPKIDKQDFLELLIEAYDLRNQYSETNIQFVADNLITFLIAGHETTAMALAWGLYALSFYPDVQDHLAQEAQLPAKDMTRTEAALKEIMRLYPPATMLSRKTTKHEEFGDLHMKPNEGIIVPIIAIHRHRKLWVNPDQFDAARFLDFTPKAMTYIPFGVGPRVCIGASFAMLEGKVILSRLMEAYRFSPSDHVPKASVVLTLRSENGLKMNIQKRDNMGTPRGLSNSRKM